MKYAILYSTDSNQQEIALKIYSNRNAQKLKKMKKIFLKQDKAGSDTNTQIEVKQNKTKE